MSVSDSNILRAVWSRFRRILGGGDASSVYPVREQESSTGDPRDLYRAALQAIWRGDSARALRILDDVIAKAPDFADAIEARAELLDRDGQVERAGEDFARSRALNARGRAGAPDRRYIFRHKGQFAFETENYRMVRQRVKGHLLPLIAEGNALFSQGKLADAMRCYDAALKAKPGRSEALAMKGEALLAMGKYKEALTAFDQVLAKCPNDPETLNSRGITKAALGKLTDADADWQRQLQLLPEFAAPARGCVAFRLGRYDTAALEFAKAIEKEPADRYWRYYRAVADGLQGIVPAPEIVPQGSASWPDTLMSCLLGGTSPEALMAQADTPSRKAEAHFALAVVASLAQRSEAANHWQEIVRSAPPYLLEFSAARRELDRAARALVGRQ